MRIMSTMIAVVLAALGVVMMLRTAQEDGSRIATPTSSPLLTAGDLPIDEVDRITITRADAPPMIFERSGSEWMQSQPFAHPMDPYSMRQMVAAARELTLIDRIPPHALGSDQSLATLQLAAPPAPSAGEITYQWAGGSLTLELGRRSVAGRAYLRRKGDDAVCIVNQRLHERVLDMSPMEWRVRRVFQHAGADSTTIGWRQGDVKMTLERDGRRWMMTDPARTRADQANLDAYLQAIGRASVSDFILDVKDEKELANFGLANPVGVLTITSPRSGAGEGTTVTERLLVGSPVGTSSQDRFAMIEGRPVIVRLGMTVIEALFRMPVNLASPTGSGVRPADVKSLVIRASGEELRLERDLEKWRAPDRDNIEVNATLVQELLNQLCMLRAPAVQFKSYPRELEAATITLHGFDGKAIDTVRIAQEKESPSTALENGDNVLRVFPQGLKLRLTAADFGIE